MIRRPHHRRPCARFRGGFTLLELMLALGLTIVLLGAIYRAMEIHWQFSVAGRIEVERSQIARALLSRISADIRSTVYRSDQAGQTATGASAGGSGGEDVSGEAFSTSADTGGGFSITDVSDPADAFASDVSGVFGDSQSLVLHISRPDREKESASSDSSSDPIAGDLKSVAYFLAGGESSLAGVVSSPLSETSPADGIEGLARMSGDRFVLLQMAGAGEAPDMAAGIELLAPEINDLAFEYYDGEEWLTEWDSTLEERLPNAIGVTIGFRAPDFPENSFLRRTASESTDTYRIVVPLSAANPFAGVVY